jgi:hypothetical protein
MSRILILLSIALFTVVGHTQDLKFQNIDQSDMKKIVNDFSAIFNHSSVSGASSLGTIFGFEVGVMGGITNTKRIDELADEGSGQNQNADQIPHGEIIGALTVPAGITVEGGFLPKLGGDKFKFQTMSLGVKWTPTDVFLDWPVSVAIKAHMTKSQAEFKQTISGVDTNFDYDNNITAFTLLVSKNFVLVEPYAGLSFLSAKGEMDVSGSPVFDPSLGTGTTSASASTTSTGFMVGAEVKLLIFKFGAEYANLFGTSRYSGKLAFYF